MSANVYVYLCLSLPADTSSPLHQVFLTLSPLGLRQGHLFGAEAASHEKGRRGQELRQHLATGAEGLVKGEHTTTLLTTKLEYGKIGPSLVFGESALLYMHSQLGSGLTRHPSTAGDPGIQKPGSAKAYLHPHERIQVHLARYHGLLSLSPSVLLTRDSHESGV